MRVQRTDDATGTSKIFTRVSRLDKAESRECDNRKFKSLRGKAPFAGLRNGGAEAPAPNRFWAMRFWLAYKFGARPNELQKQRLLLTFSKTF